MQEVCLRLMGKKLLVALAMEGKFASEGLQAIDGDDDILTAMARELVENRGIGESAAVVWRSIGQCQPATLSQAEDQAVEQPTDKPDIDLPGALPPPLEHTPSGEVNELP